MVVCGSAAVAGADCRGAPVGLVVRRSRSWPGNSFGCGSWLAVRSACDEVETVVCADGGGDAKAGDEVLEVGFGAAGQEDHGVAVMPCFSARCA